VEGVMEIDCEIDGDVESLMEELWLIELDLLIELLCVILSETVAENDAIGV
jgi:hypothetical protein